MPRESQVLKRTRAKLEALCPGRVKMYKTTGDGEPDLIGSVDGKSVVVETKQPGKKPTPLQMYQLMAWARSGSSAYWTDGEKWIQVDVFGREQEVTL